MGFVLTGFLFVSMTHGLHCCFKSVFPEASESFFFIFIQRALSTELVDVVFVLFCCCTALHLSLRRLHEARYLINDIRRAQVEGERKYSF